MKFQYQLRRFLPALLVGLLLFISRLKASGSPLAPGSANLTGFWARVRPLTDKWAAHYGYDPEVGKYAAAVAALESGRGSSRLAREANNLFGMMQPSTRKTTSIGTIQAAEGIFARFADWDASVHDYFLWCEARKMPKSATVDQWVGGMKSRGYFGAPLSVYLGSISSLVREQK